MAGQAATEAKRLKNISTDLGEEKSEASDTVAEGRVIQADPEAGSRSKKGTRSI